MGIPCHLGGEVGDKKMRAGDLWPVPSMDISFSVLAEK